MLPYNTDKDQIAYYGMPGTRQTFIYPRYPLRLAWKPEVQVSRIKCHELASEDLQNALDGIWLAYGRDRIMELGLDLFGGTTNVRRIRGGTKWSSHAFGSAIDIHPLGNRLSWGRERALFAQPEYEMFLDIMELHNFASLGRAKNYDWMHFARVKYT